MQPIYIPVLKFNRTNAVMYQANYGDIIRSSSQVENEKKLVGGTANARIGINGKRKVKQLLNEWLGAVQDVRNSKKYGKLKQLPYITFVTLTLPTQQKHDDRIIKRECLNNLIVWLKKVKKVKHYYWRAELQRNGNIHFHLIIDRFVDWEELRIRWNSAINKLGYVDNYQSKMQKIGVKEYCRRFGGGGKVDKAELVKRYNKGVASFWANPNTSDIHKLSKIKNVIAYVTKYVCKDSENELIWGRVHGYSDELGKVRAMAKEVVGYYWEVARRLDKSEEVKVIVCDNYTVYLFDVEKYARANDAKLYNELKRHKIGVFEQLYIPKLNRPPPPTIIEVAKKRKRKNENTQMSLDLPTTAKHQHLAAQNR